VSITIAILVMLRAWFVSQVLKSVEAEIRVLLAG